MPPPAPAPRRQALGLGRRPWRRLGDPAEQLYRFPRGGGNDDKAHPPIHPVKARPPDSNWDSKKQKVYEFVVRHFLACCSEAAVGHRTSVEIEVGAEGFHTAGEMVVARNWLDVYKYDRWGGRELPPFHEGMTFTPSAVELRESETRPPAKLTEADLISAMEKNGIGTDATMAQHIEKILSRRYCTRNDDTMEFSPTPLGEALVMACREMNIEALWEPFLRKEIETRLNAIAGGRLSKDTFLAGTISDFRGQFVLTTSQEALLTRVFARYFEPLNRRVGQQALASGLPEETVSTSCQR